MYEVNHTSVGALRNYRKSESALRCGFSAARKIYRIIYRRRAWSKESSGNAAENCFRSCSRVIKPRDFSRDRCMRVITRVIINYYRAWRRHTERIGRNGTKIIRIIVLPFAYLGSSYLENEIAQGGEAKHARLMGTRCNYTYNCYTSVTRAYISDTNDYINRRIAN